MFRITTRLIPLYASILALALLAVIGCDAAGVGPAPSPTPPPGMFSTLPTTESPAIGDQPGVVINLGATATPEPTGTQQPTYTPAPTPTPYPAATPYPTPTPAPQPTYTPVPTPTPGAHANALPKRPRPNRPTRLHPRRHPTQQQHPTLRPRPGLPM